MTLSAYRARERSMRFRQYPNGHRLDRKTMVRCGFVGCPYRAEFCEYSPNGSAAPGSFFHYCSGHWTMKSPGLNSTPRERAMGRA